MFFSFNQQIIYNNWRKTYIDIVFSKCKSGIYKIMHICIVISIIYKYIYVWLIKRGFKEKAHKKLFTIILLFKTSNMLGSLPYRIFTLIVIASYCEVLWDTPQVLSTLQAIPFAGMTLYKTFLINTTRFSRLVINRPGVAVAVL